MKILLYLCVFQGRESEEYLSGLAASITRISRGIFGGVLVFLSSYSHLETLERFLNKGSGMRWLEAIKDSKAVFTEPRKAADLPLLLQQFKQQIDRDFIAFADSKENERGMKKRQTTGALLFAVCKGKIAEGESPINTQTIMILLIILIIIIIITIIIAIIIIIITIVITILIIIIIIIIIGIIIIIITIIITIIIIIIIAIIITMITAILIIILIIIIITILIIIITVIITIIIIIRFTTTTRISR